MLALVRNSLDPKYTSHWFWALALLALFVEMCFHALLPISISNDTYGYLALSQHIGNAHVSVERSIGYPLFLAILGTTLADTFIPVILAQAAMAVAIPLIVFRSLLRFGLGYAVLAALIACVCFYNFIASLYFLTEPAYVFAIAVYAFFLIRYFQNPTLRNLLLAMASCGLLGMIRVSGTLHFFSLLGGIALFILLNWMRKNPDAVKLGLRQFATAVAIYLAVIIAQSLITQRTSSVVWPHFVFNWTYRDASEGDIYYGIIKPENGPAAKRLFQQVEDIIATTPSAFTLLKEGGTEKVKSIKPQKNGQYSPEAVKLLMDDLIHNNKHPIRSWWIEGVLSGHGNLGVLKASEILGDAVIEGFLTHPEVILKRLNTIFSQRIKDQILNGIQGNIVSMPTAYYHQIPKDINAEPHESLRPGLYKQWVYDLFQHTGNDPANRTIEYPQTYPFSLAGAIVNIKSDNLIGFGHYIAVLGTQVLRLCWILIGLGIFVFPFARHQPLLGSLLCASIVPPVLSVFMSETDARHLLMSAPLHIVTAVFAVYSLIDVCATLKQKFRGKKYAA